MKKSVLTVALAVAVAGAFAQDLTSSKGEKYLPEAKDWSIGLDASGVINNIGSIVSAKSASGSINGMGGGTNYIIGKMFKDEKTAYRGVLGLNFGSETTKSLVAAIPATNPTTYVENSVKLSSNEITLGGGLEKRRGTTRLQGYYGGMLLINLGGSKTTNTYGNAISASNQVSNITSSKNGSTFGLNAVGFVGAEYFVLPKVSIGAEYWWGIGFSSTGEGETVVESWNGTGITSTTTKTAGGSSFNIGGSYASLLVNLHF